MPVFDPVIVFLVAWLLLALIGEIGLEATASKALRIIVIVVALILVIVGAAHGA